MPAKSNPASLSDNATQLANQIADNVKDVVYVGVGLGVIAFQRAQVRRQELQKLLRGQATDAKDQFGSVSAFVEDRVKVVEERLTEVENRVEDLLDDLEKRLPEQAADLVKQARATAKDARGQLQSLVNRASAA